MPNKARQGQTNPNPTPAPTPELQEHQGRENSPESASGKGLPPASIAFASAFLREHLPRRKKQPANDGTVFRGRGRGEVHSGGGGGGADQEAAGKQKKGKTETTCKSTFSGRAVGGRLGPQNCIRRSLVQVPRVVFCNLNDRMADMGKFLEGWLAPHYKVSAPRAANRGLWQRRAGQGEKKKGRSNNRQAQTSPNEPKRAQTSPNELSGAETSSKEFKGAQTRSNEPKRAQTSPNEHKGKTGRDGHRTLEP